MALVVGAVIAPGSEEMVEFTVTQWTLDGGAPVTRTRMVPKSMEDDWNGGPERRFKASKMFNYYGLTV